MLQDASSPGKGPQVSASFCCHKPQRVSVQIPAPCLAHWTCTMRCRGRGCSVLQISTHTPGILKIRCRWGSEWGAQAPDSQACSFPKSTFCHDNQILPVPRLVQSLYPPVSECMLGTALAKAEPFTLESNPAIFF